MQERGPRLRERIIEYALGILTESAYVVVLSIAAVIIAWLLLRWF